VSEIDEGFSQLLGKWYGRLP